MASTEMKIELGARKLMHRVKVTVKVKNTWVIKFGLLFIRLGCWITGARFVDESEEK